MKKIILILLIPVLFASCKQGRNAESVQNETNTQVCPIDSATNPDDSLIYLIESVMHDTIRVVPGCDSVMIDLRAIENQLDKEKAAATVLKGTKEIYAADSAYKVFQKDSINFRRITKIVNGGYNGWDDRYRLWLNARKVLEEHNKTSNNTP